MLSALPTHTPKKDTRELWEDLDMSVTLIVVMVSLVCTYFKAHQIVHIKYVQLFYINYTSITL